MHISIENVVVFCIIMIIIFIISEKQSLMMMRYICMKALLENKLNLGDLTEACRNVNCRATCSEKHPHHASSLLQCLLTADPDQIGLVHSIIHAVIPRPSIIPIDLASKTLIRQLFGGTIDLLYERLEMITSVEQEKTIFQQSYNFCRKHPVLPAVDTQQIQSVATVRPLDLPGLSGTQNRSPLPRPAQEIVSDGIWTSANGVSQLVRDKKRQPEAARHIRLIHDHHRERATRCQQRIQGLDVGVAQCLVIKHLRRHLNARCQIIPNSKADAHSVHLAFYTEIIPHFRLLCNLQTREIPPPPRKC